MISAKLDFGVNTYDPDIAESEVKFKRLMNLHPRKGRLCASNCYSAEQTLTSGLTIRAIGYYTEPSERYSAVYAITDTSIHRYNFTTGQFDDTPIYTGFIAGNDPYVIVPWYNKIYITKRNAPVVRVEGPVATVVSGMPRARYGLVSANHMMFANVQSDSEQMPTRIRWSDLYLPEAFEILTSSESDYFDLEPQDEEITGLSYQRGANVIYSRNSIWIAKYFPLPTGYKFDPLFTGLGNIFHGAQIRVKETDLFIGEDNFYLLDGFQLSEIGNDIWSFFDGLVDRSSSRVFRAFHIPEREEVSWTFPISASADWSVVYNFRTKQWSDRDPQNIHARLRTQFILRGFNVIDDNSSVIDTVSSTIDGDWQFPLGDEVLYQGGASGKIYHNIELYQDFDGTSMPLEAETFEFTLGALFETKEFTRITIFYETLGTPDVRLLVGTRKHRADSVVWSSAELITNQLPGETTFHFRNKGVGRLVRFKFQINNVTTDYVFEITNLEIDFVDNSNDDPEE